MHLTTKAIAWIVLSLLLVGCGGGSSPQPTVVVDSEPAPETFTVTGTITLKSASTVLLESAGMGALQVLRTGPSEPESPPAQKILTGHVSAADTRPPGIAGDESADRYFLHLQQGQHIVLEFEDSAAADLHLYLLDEFGVALDASVDAAYGPTAGSRNLSVLVPETGRYVVRVFADRGDAAYSLRLYPTVSRVHEAQRGIRVSDEFMVHQVLSWARPETAEAVASHAQAVGLRRLRGSAVAAALWEVPPGQVGRVLDSVRGWRPRERDVIRWTEPVLLERYETLLIARSLREQPEVAAASPNFILRPQQVSPNDPRYPQQWFHRSIGLPEAWETSTGMPDDAEVVVAVVDTGVFQKHEDLQGKLLPGYDFLLDEPGGNDPGPGSWHGTHVAGIVGASTDNGVGIAGISWGAKILPVRALSDENGSLADLLEGIRYSARLPNASGTLPERRADVINLSLGGSFPCDANQRGFFQGIRDLGVFLVAASGNSQDGSGAITFPASCDAVFAVGATDRDSARAPYSHYGNGLDFVAPGGLMRSSQSPDGILSTIAPDSSDAPETGYAFYMGTSMATAVASGVVALARAIDPDLTPDRFAEMMECGLLTDDIGVEGWDSETGWGQINALKTLQAVRENRDGVHPTSGLVGNIHVRLLNAARETVAETTVDRQNCRYPYRFENVPKGDYWIVAGTEKDDDDWMSCSPGEACGAFPTLDNPEPVSVHRDRDGLDFSVVIDH